MRDYPNLRDFLTALPEGIKRRKGKLNQVKKKIKKKKKKPWDETVTDLSRLKIPKRKLREKKELLRSKNQEIAKVLIEQQKRKHFQRKAEMREQEEEDEQERLQRIIRRETYNPVLEATKGGSHSYRISEAGIEDNSSDEYDYEESSSCSQEPEVGKLKTKRITSEGRNDVLDNILNQLGDFLESVEIEKKKTKEFRERALEIFERQGEKIKILEEEIAHLRSGHTEPFIAEASVVGPQLDYRVTSRPFNPPTRVSQPRSQTPTKPLYQNDNVLPVSPFFNPVKQKKIVDRERYGLMGRSIFAACND